QLLEGDDVPAMVLLVARARVVQYSEVNHRADAARSKHVSGLLAAQVDAMMDDVLREAFKDPSIDADHRSLAVQAPGQQPPEAPADARDEHRPQPFLTLRRCGRRRACGAEGLLPWSRLAPTRRGRGLRRGGARGCRPPGPCGRLFLRDRGL